MKFPVEVWRSLTGSQIRCCEEISFLSRGKWAYVRRQYLAGKIGVSIWQVSRITSRLVEMGVMQKMQRRYRRRDGTWDSRPCLYRLAGVWWWKFNQLVNKLTGVRSAAPTPCEKEKVTPPDMNFVKNGRVKAILEGFLALKRHGPTGQFP